MSTYATFIPRSARAPLEHARVRERECAEALEGVVHALKPPRLERVVRAVDMRRETRIPDEPGGGAHRARSSVTNENANGWRASAGCARRSTSRQSFGSSSGK